MVHFLMFRYSVYISRVQVLDSELVDGVFMFVFQEYQVQFKYSGLNWLKCM